MTEALARRPAALGRRSAPRGTGSEVGGVLQSAVYEGTLYHRRFGPGPEHHFSYHVAMPLLYLDEVESVMALHPLWSSKQAAAVRFRREDFLGDPASPLPEAVLDRVYEHSGRRPTGPVALLANLRTWGYLFNPISLYYCFEGDGEAVGAAVADVENTPWHERQSYVVGPPGSHRFRKQMHVSPFLPMDVHYELRYSTPGRHLFLGLDVLRGGERLLSARLSLSRLGMDRRALGRLLWGRPALTHRVSAGIYAQAGRLKLKGAPFYAHPRTRAGPPRR